MNWWMKNKNIVDCHELSWPFERGFSVEDIHFWTLSIFIEKY